MRSIAVDTGPLVAVVDAQDRYHASALGFFERTRAPLVTNLPVLTEAAHLLNFSNDAVCDFLKWVSSAFTIDIETPADLPRIVEVMRKYADLPADLADASLLAMCERRGITAISTIDRDFDIYRLSNGRALDIAFEK